LTDYLIGVDTAMPGPDKSVVTVFRRLPNDKLEVVEVKTIRTLPIVTLSKAEYVEIHRK